MKSPINLRINKETCVPEGPAFSSAKQVKFSLNGTEIEFIAPKHKPSSRDIKEQDVESKYNFSDLTFRSTFDKDFQLEDTWKSCRLLFRSWTFNGPWFTGSIAELDMYVNLIRPKDLNNNVSFFHPRAFESAIGDYLTNEYSVPKVDGRSSWIAPNEWKPIRGLPVVATRLHVLPDELVARRNKAMYYLFFPVADQCFAQILFYPVQLHSNGQHSQAEKDQVVSREKLFELMENIISSLKITLSPEAQAWQAKALEGLEDTALIKNFPPMKWTTEKEDALWALKNPQK